MINLASGVTWERLTPSNDPTLEFLHAIYEPGSESCPEDSLVRHGGTEYGYVLSGARRQDRLRRACPRGRRLGLV